MSCSLTVKCPDMPVFGTDDPLIYTTTELECPVTLTLDDGTEVDGKVDYLICLIRFIYPTLWRVDPAPALGTLRNGWQIGWTLDKEDVTWDGIGEREAQEVKGTGAIWTTNLSNRKLLVATINIDSPKVGSYRGAIGEFIVKECVETGNVKFLCTV